MRLHVIYSCGQCCAQVIKLSDTVQPFPRSVTMCVHGAARSFIELGAAKNAAGDGALAQHDNFKSRTNMPQSITLAFICAKSRSQCAL